MTTARKPATRSPRRTPSPKPAISPEVAQASAPVADAVKALDVETFGPDIEYLGRMWSATDNPIGHELVQKFTKT